MATTIKFIGSTADNLYAFNIVEDGEVLPVVGVNETGNSDSLRFVLRPVQTLPQGLRLWNSFRLTGNADGSLETHWEGQVYRSRWNLLPQADGTVVLTSTPQRTDAQLAAETAARNAAATTTTSSPTTTTPPPPAVTTSTAGIGIGALVLGAFALYAFLS